MNNKHMIYGTHNMSHYTEEYGSRAQITTLAVYVVINARLILRVMPRMSVISPNKMGR